MEWKEGSKAVFFLVVFLQLSSHQWTVNAVPLCSGTGPTCITSCRGLADGNYQSCKGCHFYASCSNEILTDKRPCNPIGLYWDDNAKACLQQSTTCYNCNETPPTTTPPTTTTTTPEPTDPPTTTTTQEPTIPPCHGTGSACIESCSGKVDGDYQSCNGCQVFATCSNGYLYDDRPCAPGGTYWDDNVKRCEYQSTTCQECTSRRKPL